MTCLCLPLLYLLFTLCLADPNPLPDPIPQLTNNAPFSGIVYLVYPNGQPVDVSTLSGSTNLCPQQAPLSCSSVGQPS